MTASSTRRGGWPAAAGLDGLAALVATALGGGAAAAALAAGLVLMTRRAAVGFDAAVGPGVVLPVTAAGAALVALADTALRSGGPRQASHAARAGLVLAVAAVALPPRAANWLEAAATALAIAIAAAAVTLGPRPGSAPPALDHRRPSRSAPARRRRRPVTDRLRGRLRQRFTRYDAHEGGDRLRGRINVEIGAGARLAHGHVGFCPAFAATPAVVVSTDYDGVEATVTAAEVLPWGVRVEVRLAEPAEEPLQIPVDLLVRGPE
jgi:hypothetical protein